MTKQTISNSFAKAFARDPFALECQYNIITRRIVTSGTKEEMEELAKTLNPDIKPAVIPNPQYHQKA